VDVVARIGVRRKRDFSDLQFGTAEHFLIHQYSELCAAGALVNGATGYRRRCTGWTFGVRTKRERSD
jgi:hypothetical protein